MIESFECRGEKFFKGKSREEGEFKFLQISELFKGKSRGEFKFKGAVYPSM